MGAQRRTYMKVPCGWCGRRVGRNNMTLHQRVCPKKPLEEMTVGEMFGRYAERADVKAYIAERKRLLQERAPRPPTIATSD